MAYTVAMQRLDTLLDMPDAKVYFFDTGRFALETHAADIASAMRSFLG